MATGSGYIGWILSREERERLLACFPPAYSTVVAHHVTLAFNVRPDAPPPTARAGLIVGRANDGKGIDALVLEIEGTARRPDGSTYHVTWSLEPGRRPAEANTLIRAHGWQAVEPVHVALKPAFFPFARRR